ncbi:MAG: EAL domain-containing protein [Burkholderiales bacterium]|nr:EAL domain-containing protein [Burkholderiales bacterium]
MWILVWPIGAIILACAGWTVLHTNLKNERQETENAALREALLVARNYASQLALTFQTLDQLTLHIRYEWHLSEGRLPLETARQKKLFTSGPRVEAAIIDRDGNLLTSTVVAPNAKYFGDRQSYLIQKAAIIDTFFMGGPYPGRLTRETRLHFSRGISRADGSFDGAVLLSVAPAYFTTTYSETTLGKNGILAIVSDHYQVMVSRIGEIVWPPDRPAFSATPYFSLLFGSQRLAGNAWFRDGRNRFIGWQQIEGLPLVAVAGIDEEGALAPYYLMRQSAIRHALFATSILAVFTCIAMLLSIRLAWRKYQLELTQATYRMATEEGNEGFYIAKPVHDKVGGNLDFQIIDCNSFGAKLFHERRESMLGKYFSALFNGQIMADLQECMRQAMENGFFEGEIQIPFEWIESAPWLHLKMVRSDGEVAITMRDISEIKAHVSELERRGYEDALTGLPNRHWIQNFLPQAIDRAHADQSMLALLFIDLDGFKSVNDTMGHLTGDELLRYAAERLKVAVRPHDNVVRLGGDEFVVIVEHLSHKEDAALVADRVVVAFKEKFRLSQGMHAIGTSIGISIFPDDGADAAMLLQNADIAMYSAKTAGKGQFSFYERKFYEALRSRLTLEKELRHALENDEFLMHYQPRIDIMTGTMSSMEALVRWQHPVRGLLEPTEFIALAEESSLILGIGELVLGKVCAQLASWAKQGDGKIIPVSVNVSPRQFNHAGFTKVVTECLQRYQVDPAWLEIEVTESCMMGKSHDVSSVMTALKRKGIKFSIDDFGTGYSSLSQLQQLDFDVLKVDRAFTSKVAKTEEGEVFFTAIITMAHALGMRVVAEGVENQQQWRILKHLRCDEIQGFYISKPVPPAEQQPALERIPVMEHV